MRKKRQPPQKYQRPERNGALSVESSTAAKVTHCSVTYLSMSTCEGNGCPLFDNGCMAQLGNMQLHSSRIHNKDPLYSTAREAEHIDWLSGRRPLRLRESGDQWDEASLAFHTVPAARRYITKHQQPVWTYTHNYRNIDRSAWGPISVLASVHSAQEVRTANNRGYPAAALLPEAKNKTWKEDGNTFVHCPNETKGMLCIDCQLCMKADYLLKNRLVIVFTPHGNKRKHINNLYSEGKIGEANA